MSNDNEENVILLYEIWSTICDIEISRYKNAVLQQGCLLMAQSACESLFELIQKHLITKEDLSQRMI